MSYVNGVNLMPATGEFTYSPTAYQGARLAAGALQPMTGINNYSAAAGGGGDVVTSINQLLAAFPACTTVALVVAWFFNSENAASCDVYPSTTYINPTPYQSFEYWNGSGWTRTSWLCSSLTESSSGLIPISQTNGSFTYGGTPSDQSIVHCIQYIKGKGLRVVFYPFLLGDIPGSNPWRGRITYCPEINPSTGLPANPDVSSAASAAVASFLGSAATSWFTRDMTNLTVSYSGSPTDWTFRRMILHYANLCVVAGGVDLFLLGSELRGLETIRGPFWTESGAVSAGSTTWDYPFVSGLATLASDVRSIFDGAGYTRDRTGLHNLISYAADWSSWMGYQHTLSNPSNPGQWPHLDQLWGDANIDLVCFDNYLPLSDWTAATNGGQDAVNWSAGAPSAWPPADPNAVGLSLTGQPTIYNIPYLKANIEGGEKFNWFYNDGTSAFGVDPNGSDLRVTCPRGDRLSQDRQRYYSGQEILANKQLRWWWNNQHYAIYPTMLGGSWNQQGSPTLWTANAKSITFTEYGFPSNDRSTNQPNVFFTGNSIESATAYWSVWDPSNDGGYQPRGDQSLQLLALQAFYEYWFTDTPSNNATVDGVEMIESTFCSVWNWDARPFPWFPNQSGVWGDTGNWQAGNWLSGKGPFIAPPVADAPPSPGSWPAFPELPGQGWGVIYRPEFATGVAEHSSGRSSRLSRMSFPVYEIEIRAGLTNLDIGISGVSA